LKALKIIKKKWKDMSNPSKLGGLEITRKDWSLKSLSFLANKGYTQSLPSYPSFLQSLLANGVLVCRG
jgi:hypothetical protein